MPDFIYQVAIRLAVAAPTTMIVFALVWYLARLFGALDTDTFNARSLRTWPLMLVLWVAAVFALVSASLVVALGEGTWSGAIASGVAALVAVGLVPRLWARFAAVTPRR